MAIKKKITSSALKALSVSDKRINDTEVSGFHALKFESGKVVYYVYYRLDGKQVNHKLGLASDLSPSQARDLAKVKLGQVAQGSDVQEQRKEARQDNKRKSFLNFDTFLTKKYFPYLESRNPKTSAKIFKHLRSQFSHLLHKDLDQITAWDIEKWKSERVKLGRAASTINYSINTLKGALSRAVDWELIESHNLKAVKVIKADNTRIRYLSSLEEKRLFDEVKYRDQSIREKRESANKHREIRGNVLFSSFDGVRFVDYVEPIIITAINTGLRRGELLSLLWSDIYFEQRYLKVRATNSKSKKSRIVPLNDSALEALRLWRQQNSYHKFVFIAQEDKPLTDIKKPWLKLIEKAGIDNFNFHDLRHHFASKLVMAGVDLNTVRELLGHSDLKMTLRYAHLAPEHKAAAVNLIG
ncbi:site-specific integrase [Vibrio sp. SS-MA-C1-2]|uniref:site-specific integrase n=1 Tax=Vibrio sp. SS-MA-C1-2 TaxID=2908646 RepID=UPI001F333E8A|nr:site-specific integrase [Vibrio sp. SS-MA-C1-2]UJF19132.1 site-specific integrase [Vibrio sp. SS-MA-C1-2]